MLHIFTTIPPRWDLALLLLTFLLLLVFPRQHFNDLHVWGYPILHTWPYTSRWKENSLVVTKVSLQCLPWQQIWLSVPLILNPTTNHISPQFHVIFDDLFSTVISQLEYKEPPKEWNDLCITSCYQPFFGNHDPTKLDNEWLATDELILQNTKMCKKGLHSQPQILILFSLAQFAGSRNQYPVPTSTWKSKQVFTASEGVVAT